MSFLTLGVPQSNNENKAGDDGVILKQSGMFGWGHALKFYSSYSFVIKFNTLSARKLQRWWDSEEVSDFLRQAFRRNHAALLRVNRRHLLVFPGHKKGCDHQTLVISLFATLVTHRVIILHKMGIPFFGAPTFATKLPSPLLLTSPVSSSTSQEIHVQSSGRYDVWTKCFWFEDRSFQPKTLFTRTALL